MLHSQLILLLSVLRLRLSMEAPLIQHGLQRGQVAIPSWLPYQTQPSLPPLWVVACSEHAEFFLRPYLYSILIPSMSLFHLDDFMLLLCASLQRHVFEEENNPAVRLLAGDNVEICRDLDAATFSQHNPVPDFIHSRYYWSDRAGQLLCTSLINSLLSEVLLTVSCLVETRVQFMLLINKENPILQ